jgi:curli biogenesis system outer membrane secretion channel CsgG
MAEAQAAKRRPRIAVLDFDYATVQSSSSAMFGTNVDIGKGITSLLVNNLVKDGTFSIIERAALDKIMTEQNFSNSQRADPSSAAKLGKLLGVDAIIVGSITQFGNETKKVGVGGGGGGLGGFGLGGVGHSNSKANVTIDARVVNVDTGEILAVAEGTGQSSRSSTSLLGGGGHGWSSGGGNVDFGSSNFQETIIGEATKAAVEKLTADVVSNAPKIAVRTITVDGLVAAVDDGQIVINVGKQAGISVGDQLEVVRVTKELHRHHQGHRRGRHLGRLHRRLRFRLPDRRPRQIHGPITAPYPRNTTGLGPQTEAGLRWRPMPDISGNSEARENRSLSQQKSRFPLRFHSPG